MKKLKTALLGVLLLLASPMFAAPDYSGDYLGMTDPWSIFVYHGALVENDLFSSLTSGNFSDITITSLEVAKELSPNNIIRHYFAPWITTVSFNTNVSYIHDPGEGAIYEIDPFFMFRWEHFPWDKYIVNTYGIGWGISYDSKITSWEQHDSDNTKNLLNYLAFETTFALPKYPQWQLVLRLHHRSGVFGLYGADNSGSNYLGAGIRYNF